MLDNMEARAADGVLTGTVDWERRQIVFDVPEEAESLHNGFYLRGVGKSWARAFRLNAVSSDVPVTVAPERLQAEPTNLEMSGAAG